MASERLNAEDVDLSLTLMNYIYQKCTVQEVDHDHFHAPCTYDFQPWIWDNFSDGLWRQLPLLTVVPTPPPVIYPTSQGRQKWWWHIESILFCTLVVSTKFLISRVFKMTKRQKCSLHNIQEQRSLKKRAIGKPSTQKQW